MELKIGDVVILKGGNFPKAVSRIATAGTNAVIELPDEERKIIATCDWVTKAGTPRY